MARPSSAAGGLLACAVLLLFAGQSSAAFVFPFEHLLGYEPPTVRIYSKQNPSLNMAVRNGKVVMITATADDVYDTTTQLWWKIPHGEGDKHWLVNVATNMAMTSPGSIQAVQLAEFNFYSGEQLWVPSPLRPEDNGFYQIKSYTHGYLALNGFTAYASARRSASTLHRQSLPTLYGTQPM